MSKATDAAKRAMVRASMGKGAEGRCATKRPKSRLLGRTPSLFHVMDPTVQLSQAARLLKLIEAVGSAADLGVDGRELMKAMKFARKLVEHVIVKLVADKGAKGGAK